MNDYIFRAAVKDQEILLLDEEGMVYMGKRITDAGEAGAAWIETMKMMQESAMRKPLSDEEILRIAAKSPPFIPWLLQEGVTLGDVRGMAVDFARRIEKAHGIGETE